MKYVQIATPFNQLAIDGIIKPDERIVCRNATVTEDSRGQVSWIDNDKPLCIAANEE